MRALPADRFYHFQLIGLTVFDTRRGVELGRVAEVLSYAANDVLRVTDGDHEVLIPMVREVVRAITPGEGTIRVDLPEDTQA
jgi:16S rRNA processing protein RimM